MEELKGAGVALITPFDANGAVDYPALERLIEHQIHGGIDYLVSLGTTGETATLTPQEKESILAFTVQKVAGRKPLVVGIGGNHTAEILTSFRTWDLKGFAAILSVSPYYNKPTQEGIYQHYKALSQSSPLPIILYNVPARTSSNMTAETTLRLAHDFKNIVAIKEASGLYDQYSKIMRDKPDDFLLISGDDPATLPMAALGASGVISVVGNAFPGQVQRLTQACLKGDYATARNIHEQLIQITELCFVEGNPAGIKAILQERGICDDHLRLPLVPVSSATKQSIRKALDLLKGNLPKADADLAF